MIERQEAIRLIAKKNEVQRLKDETDIELVQRIRNGLRKRVNERTQRQYEEIDNRLKQEAIEEYYIENPGAKETVEDFE